jgi:carbamoyltransferase
MIIHSMKKTTYIGFSSTQHDPAIAIVNNEGELIFAQGNERCLKNKRAWNTVPDDIGVLKEIDSYINTERIKASMSWSNSGLRWSPVIFTLSRIQKWWIENFSKQSVGLGKLYMNQGLRQAMYKAPSSYKDMLINLEYRLFEKNNEIEYIKTGHEHHLCHAATACYTSQFNEGICLVLDGMGEGSSYSIFKYENGEITPLIGKPFLNMASIGFLYSAVCWGLGFDPVVGEEWKVMGLAPYGKKDHELYELLRPMVRVDGIFLVQAKDYAERLTTLIEMRDLTIAAIEKADLAFTAQLVFEEIVIELINNVHKKFGGKNLLMAGGCTLNSTCNGKIISGTPYTNLHVPMAPGDDGNCIGSAFLSWKEDNPDKRVRNSHTPYLGSSYKEEVLERVVILGKHKVDICDNNEELTKKIAEKLSVGKLIGWFQGRAEFGPRSLGNRSILADPRNTDVKDKINSRIKFREEFRPFAPSILHEKGEAFFKNYEYSPYMERTLEFSDTKSAPGVVHENNSGRLQSVTEELNPLYHQLISEFEKITGVPVLLNTSFNIMGRPIVHDVEDAIALFYTSGLDVLVIGNHIFEK